MRTIEVLSIIGIILGVLGILMFYTAADSAVIGGWVFILGAWSVLAGVVVKRNARKHRDDMLFFTAIMGQTPGQYVEEHMKMVMGLVVDKDPKPDVK